METTINQKTVSISTRDKTSFVYDGVEASKLKELNETLYNEVLEKVIYFVDNKEKIEKEEREKEIEATKVKEKKTLEELKAEILNEDVDFTGWEVSYREPDGKSYFRQEVKIEKIGCKDYHEDFEIEYDNQVSGRGYYSKTTNKVWCLNFDYKTTRYAKLENAIKKGMEKVNAKIEERKEKKNDEAQKDFAESEMKKFAEDNGFEYSKDYHSYSTGRSQRRNNYYYTHYMSKGRVKANLQYNGNDLGNKVSITSYTVSKKEKQEITIEELKAINNS